MLSVFRLTLLLVATTAFALGAAERKLLIMGREFDDAVLVSDVCPDGRSDDWSDDDTLITIPLAAEPYVNRPTWVAWLNSAASSAGAAVVTALQGPSGVGVDDLSPVDHHQNTPLHEAASRGFVEQTRELVARLLATGNKVALSVPNKHGKTPLRAAILCEHPDIAEILIVAGAKLTDLTSPTELLHWAIVRNHTAVALTTIKRVVDEQQDLKRVHDEDTTVLHAACDYVRTDVVQALVAAGVNLAARTTNGVTPLHVIAGKQFPQARIGGMVTEAHGKEIIQFLTHEALWTDVALVDAVDAQRQTPLMYAARAGNFDIVKCLLESCGADPCIKDKKGHTAVRIALEIAGPQQLEPFRSIAAYIEQKQIARWVALVDD